MKLKIEYYGQLAEECGKSEETLELSAATLAELKKQLENMYSFQNIALTLAVNNQFVEENYPLNPEDKIAVMPPFAGG
jgi:molybdopterin converting factor small subunit